MLRVLWQKSMIALARAPRLKRYVQSRGPARRLARKYVAGGTAAAAVRRAEELLRDHNLRGSLFFLGEYVDQPALVAENVASGIDAAQALGESSLDVHVSVDPTQLGYMIDPALGRRNAFAIAQEVAAARNGSRTRCLMLDMEDESLVDVTIALHDELRASNLPAALTLQAYLRRTEDDLRAMLAQPCRVRLIKGAFAAGRRLAFQGQAAIKANFRRLTDLMLSGAARKAGFQPSFATYDHELHDYVLAQAGAANWRPGEYEFEMLLGVRGDVAEGLARRGERVRLYLPFGHDWWPYAARRIGESPRNLWLLARSLAGPGRGDGLPDG
jgi:proline dehydrogenase